MSTLVHFPNRYTGKVSDWEHSRTKMKCVDQHIFFYDIIFD